MKKTTSLLLTYRAYHAVLYALIALVVARMTKTPFHALDYFAIALASTTIFVWNTFLDLEEDRIARPDNNHAFLSRHMRAGLALGAAGALVALAIAARQGNIAAFASLLFPLLAGFLYSQHLFGTQLKRLLVVKTAVAVAIWVSLCVFYPLFNSRPGFAFGDFTLGHWAAAVWTLSFFTVGEIASDIKDIEGDRAAGADTIAMRLGPAATLGLTTLLSLPGLVWTGFHILAGGLDPQFWFMAGFPVALNGIFLASYVLVRNPAHCVLRSVWMQDRAVYGYLLILLTAAGWAGA